jgi:hypothetical protein
MQAAAWSIPVAIKLKRKEVRKMEKTERVVNVGDRVIYVDPKGTCFDALVTAIWSRLPNGCLNLVYVVDNENQTDQYGRQLSRATSMCHKDYMKVHGSYWMFADEQPNNYVAPLES